MRKYLTHNIYICAFEKLIHNGLVIDNNIINHSITYNIVIPNYQKYEIILTEETYLMCCYKSFWEYDFYKNSNIPKKILNLRFMFKNDDDSVNIIKYMKDNNIKPDRYCYLHSYINNTDSLTELFIKFNCNPPLEIFYNNDLLKNRIKIFHNFIKIYKNYEMSDIYEEFILSEI
jgi:hypothetical protein